MQVILNALQLGKTSISFGSDKLYLTLIKNGFVLFLTLKTPLVTFY